LDGICGQRGTRLELQAAELGDIVLVNVYIYCRPASDEEDEEPEATPDTWEELRERLEEVRCISAKPIVMVGDFNPPSSKGDDAARARALQDFYEELGESMGLAPIVQTPTHEKGRVLDQIFIAPEIEVVGQVEQEQVPGCDHSMVFVTIRMRDKGRVEAPQRIRWKALNQLTER
jgi:hypothetical protein